MTDLQQNDQPSSKASSGPEKTTRALPKTNRSGLSPEGVAQRVEEGKNNVLEERTSRPISQIIRANVFTLFNAIIFTAMILVLITGRWKDALFGFVLIINTGIGIFSEVKSKRTLDKLSILVQDTYAVHRSGKDQEISRQDIVLDDLLWIRSGEQVPADGTVLENYGLELDESMLTGESRTVRKNPGDQVQSGSTAISGLALITVTAVGAHSYAARLTEQVKKFSKTHSDLNDGINKILRVMTLVGIPMVFLLAFSQMRVFGGLQAAVATGAWRDADVSAVSGVVGMIPEGLVLLTSLNFAIAAMRLARQNTLVQELDAVETLARVDALNCDKTGTITDGGIACDQIIYLDDEFAEGNAGSAKTHGAPIFDHRRLDWALWNVCSEESPNATGKAVLEYFKNKAAAEGRSEEGKSSLALSQGQELTVCQRTPFSSVRKWSSLTDSQAQRWYFGAPEILLAAFPDDFSQLRQKIEKLTEQGSRVLLFARADKSNAGPEDIAPSLVPSALVVCSESIRPDARQTLLWFRQQGVRCRVISGDNPATVSAIAAKVGLTGDSLPRYMDARNLSDDPATMAGQLEDIDVLGRVLPEQKKAIVQALHLTGHTVAMTGDGVNDALALKEADLGIAMGNAAPATKAVAQIVLVDSKFSHLPSVVARGRQVMANMERVASLFLVKTIYSVLISLGVVLSFIPFPYLPRHITYIGALTIGIPAFILALAPNSRRYVPGFLHRVLAFAFPGGIAAGGAVLLTAWIVPALMGWTYRGDDLSQLRTVCSIVLFAVSIAVLARVARPLRSWRGILVLVFFAAGVLGGFIPYVAHFFEIHIPLGRSAVITAVAAACGLLLLAAAYAIQERISHFLADRQKSRSSDSAWAVD